MLRSIVLRITVCFPTALLSAKLNTLINTSYFIISFDLRKLEFSANVVPVYLFCSNEQDFRITCLSAKIDNS